MPKKTLLKVVPLACLTVFLLYVGLGNSPAQSQARPVHAPTPTLTVLAPLPNAQRALAHISQTTHISAERLLLADQFSKELVLTGRALSRNLVLDREGWGRLLYEVIIDTGTGEVLDSAEVEVLWEAERAAYWDRYGDRALEYVARRKGVAVSSLELANGVLESFPLTGVVLWRVKVADAEGEAIYGVALNAEGEEVDAEAIKRAEFEASRAKYGRLEPALYYLLQTRNPEDKVPVLAWVKGVDYAWVDTQLTARYPELAAEYRFASGHVVRENGSPVHLEPELFERVRADYNDLLAQAHLAAAWPVVDFLAARGYQSRALELIPGVYAKLPKSVVVELNEAPLESLGTIYWGAIEIQPALDSTAQTIRASEVWNSALCDGHGCTGAGVTIAVAEGGIIRPDIPHGALQGKIVAANVDEATDPHAATVAGVIAGDHPDFPQYRGIAYGSDSLVSAKVYNDWASINDGLNWVVDQEAFAINASISTTGTLHMQPEDRVLDYVVRRRDPTIVVGSGNRYDDPWGWNVKSPTKAYNAITVGAFDDHNDPDWSNDDMWGDSCYVNPYIDGQDIPGDRKKPEVVAVGASVVTVDPRLGDDGFRAFNGTSVAAPQVAGLAALLIERYWNIRTNPEAIKAIVMASAVNNIEGNTRLSDKDGAGGIDVSYALSVFQNGGWCYHNIHDITDFDAPDNPFDGVGAHHGFHAGDGFWDVGGTQANAGEQVRAVLAWDSNPSADFTTDGTDPLSTDFDLRIISPGGSIAAESLMFNNNYEIVDFIAPETGEYKMRVSLYSTWEESNDLALGLAWVRVPTYDATYPNHDTPGTMEAGSSRWVNLTVRNTGHHTWPASGDPWVRIGYRWYRGGSLVSEYANASGIGADLSFGDSTVRSAYLAVPTTPGNYQLKWDVALWEGSGYTWFEDLDDEPVYEPLIVNVAVVDTTPPGNPTHVESPSHTVEEWSHDDTVTANWSGASDSGSGVYGYSVLWDTSASALPDTTVDTTGNNTTSPALEGGDSHYFHVRARDNAENWAAGAIHLGPFYVDAAAPSANVVAPLSYVTTLSFDVVWQGSDPAPGSGLEGYDVQYKDGDGAWMDWLMAIPTSQTSATFTGVNHHSYYFRCRARDVVGNEGDWSAPVQTEVRTTPYLVVSPLSLLYLIDVDEPDLYTRTVTVKNEGGGTLNWSVVEDQPWLEVTPSGGAGQATLSVVVDSRSLFTGTYTAQVTVSGAEGTWWSPQTADVTVRVMEEIYRVVLPLVIKICPATVEARYVDAGGRD